MIISRVSLYTNYLNQLKEFYIDHLGFIELTSDEKSFKIKIGQSVLEFIQNDDLEKPFYHFAFNIPTDIVDSAKEWAKSKVALTTEEDEDEVYFTNSKAQSFYFLDPAGNIVEFISRKEVSPASEAPHFTTDHLLNISEINLTTNNVISIGNQLINFGIPARDNESLDSDFLNFMGEKEDGAFLLLGPKGRRWIFSDADSEVFPLSIHIQLQTSHDE
ncbi:VOC family protein [Virgibacillus flavescens]|uniref:VOC family protein n=1 Tax=Virgibacillus flavescens TaxID=1611422 RepID=UPI003D328B1F